MAGDRVGPESNGGERTMVKPKIELSSLESAFFARLIQIQLDIPAHGVLTYQSESLEMVVVPKIDQDGQFVLDYFNASPFIPPSEEGIITFTDHSIVGTHPLLEKAWLSDDPVTLQLRVSPLPPGRQRIMTFPARVQYADTNHSGRIVLWQNKLQLVDQPIKASRFSLLGFPAFLIGDFLHDLAKVQQVRESVKDLLPDGWTVNPPPKETKVVLQSGDGWEISLTKHQNTLRGSSSHEGHIARSDGSDYGLDDLETLLQGLQSFFTFVKGDYCFPTVVIAFSGGNHPVWGRIGSILGSSPNRENWFKNNLSAPEGHLLEYLFPKFWKRWIERKDEIKTAIDLYATSKHSQQNGDPLGGLAGSYAALETLASLTSGETIDRNSAGKIDHELSKYDVPLRLVSDLSVASFSEVCDELRVGSYKGAYLLNKIRNYAPHPLDTTKNAGIKSEVQAFLRGRRVPLVYLHDLSQFYFEHLFLSYCGFEHTRSRMEFGRYRQLLAEINSA